MWKNGLFLAIFAFFQARTFEIGKDERKIIVFFETGILLPSINVQTPQSLGRIWLSKLSFFPSFAWKWAKWTFSLFLALCDVTYFETQTKFFDQNRFLQLLYIFYHYFLFYKKIFDFLSKIYLEWNSRRFY